MPVELRKRKAPAPPPGPPAKKATKTGKVSKTVAKAKDAVSKPRGRPAKAAPEAAANGPSNAGSPQVGDAISLDGFGGEIETNSGTKTTLKALVEESGSGVVLFTYPKASTPGCTKQACLFRDFYEPLTAGGLAIYGLSTDSPKANTSFKENKKLPYPLLCDPAATLISAIGLKKQPKGTTRGVFVVDKTGNVLVAQPGSPDGTVDVVKKLVKELAGGDAAAVEEKADKAEKKANEAATEEKTAQEEKPAVPAAEGATEKAEESAVTNGDAEAAEEKPGEKEDE